MSHPLNYLLRHLSELWHISRTACANVPCAERKYERKKWVAAWFATDHPEFSTTCAYKAIDRMLARYPLANDEAVLELLQTALKRHQRQ